MPRLCDQNVVAACNTIAGSTVREPYDVRLDALWRHDSVKAALPREYRVELLRQASRQKRGLDAIR